MIDKITFVKPDVAFPVKKQGYRGDVGIPTGLLYLAGFVRKNNGAQVRVVDYRLERVLGRQIDAEEDLADADLIGAGCCTAESPGALKVLQKAKQMGKVTVAGGLFPTLNTEEVLRTGFVDFVVLGEGESGLSGLISSLNGKSDLRDARGIAFLKDGQVVKTLASEPIRDLDSIPLPAYDLIPMQTYAQFAPGAIYASRGCPQSCEFCTLNEFWGYRYRRRSVENILQELALFREHGFDRVHFKDEAITLNRRWGSELFREIERAGFGMRYKAKSRIDGVDDGLLEVMTSAGVDTIHTGINSVSQKSLTSMGCNVSANEIRKRFEMILSHGCQVNPVYIFSWPGETPQDLRDNVAFIEEMGQRQGVVTYVSFITPHPGSNLAFNREDELRILSTDYARYTHKQPVAVPRSLGQNGLKLMVDSYHRVAEVCKMQDVNPAIDSAYLEAITQVDEKTKVNKPSFSPERHVLVNAA